LKKEEKVIKELKDKRFNVDKQLKVEMPKKTNK
jgi:hypothetical protein